MEAAPALRKLPINPIVAAFAVLLTLTSGGLGGYWLKGQLDSGVTIKAQAPATQAGRYSAPPHELPVESANVTDAVDRALARAANTSRPSDGNASPTGH